MRIAKWNVLILTPALALTFLCAQGTTAPRPGGQDRSEQAVKKEEAQNVNVYRVTYKISELENGKTINARSYTLMAKTNRRSMSRVGSRIPVNVGGKGFQVWSVGMGLDCTVTEREGDLLVHTDLDMNTIVHNEPTTSFPVTRNLKLQDDTSVITGKPAFVGSIDDVYSNRRYVIEVTVTKVR